MNRLAAVLIAASLGVVTSSAAFGESNQLLQSDVLNPGEVNAEFMYSFTHLSGRNYKTIDRSMDMTFGVGIPGHLELDVTLPYVFRETTDTAVGREKRDGVGDLIVGARYSLIQDEKAPLSMAIGLDVKLDTAPSNATGVGTDTIDFSPFISATFNREGKVAPFIAYTATIHASTKKSSSEDSDNSSPAPDQHSLTIGAEFELPHHSAAIISGDMTYNEAGEYRSYRDYTAKLELVLNVTKHVYIIPTVSYLYTNSVKAASPTAVDLAEHRSGSAGGQTSDLRPA